MSALDSAWTADYLLRHCEEFAVDAPDGRLGFVTDVVELGDGSIELVVEGAEATLQIPARRIRLLDAGTERIAVVP